MLPAAASLRKQGANKGAVTSFLISTPESGVDSIAITYALLDPIMTIARPVAACLTALSAGLLENILSWQEPRTRQESEGVDPKKTEGRRQPFAQKFTEGFRYAFLDVWGEIAVWFYIGLGIAALITVLVPDALMARFLGGGFGSMFIMLLVGVPLYICASASTPIAAALILKGVSPGAALVFLLAGPATNITSLYVLRGLLGGKSTLRYLTVLSIGAVFFGLAVDQLYSLLGISPRAIIGEAAELVPLPLKVAATLVLAIISIRPLSLQVKRLFRKKSDGMQFVAAFPDLPGKMGGMPFPSATTPAGSGSGQHKGKKEGK